MLLKLHGASFVTITTTIDARAKKTNNPHGTILKTSTSNCQVNFYYDKAVYQQLIKEQKTPEYKKGTSWHIPYKINGKLTPLAIKKGESEPHYLRVRHLTTIGKTLYTTTTGTELNIDEINNLLPEPSKYTNQNTTNPIKFLTYNLNNIKIITFNKQIYLII